jgi:hypothetical protein
MYLRFEQLPIFIITLVTLSFPSPRTATDWKFIQSADTLNLFLSGQRAGILTQSLTVLDSGNNILLERHTLVGNNAASSGQALDLTERRSYDFSGTLLSAVQELNGSAGNSVWKLAKDARNGWTLSVTAGETQQARTVPQVSENLSMSAALYKGIKNRSIARGDLFYDTTFDLTSGRNITMSAKCSGVPAAANGYAWDFITVTSEVGREERWTIDTGGSTVYQELFPFVARKKDRQRHSGKTASLAAIIEALSIPASRAARADESVAVLLDSTLSPDSSALAFYRREGAAWIVANVAQSCAKNGGALAEEFRKFIAATTTMQCDDIRIKRLADSLVKGSKNRCDSVAACNAGVFLRLEKRYSPTFSNALETLNAGYGDCGEHAVLLGALLRALRIPARVVLGIVYVKERKGYYYHAWVMAEAGGSWVFADPAFGVFPAARDRIPLVIDDTGSEVVKIAKLIGRIKIEYVKNK